MRSSKDRTIQKKRVNKANKIAKTERSRKHRIANKHRREEIHAIDPDMKVVIINQKTFDEYGTEIEVIDGHIKAVELKPEIIKDTIEFADQNLSDFDSAVEEYKVVIEEPVVEKIKLKNKSALQRLTDRFKKG